MKRQNWLIFNISRRGAIFLVIWLLLVGLLLGAKAVATGWFQPRLSLDLMGQPALLFFNSEHGCPCALIVYQAADRQIKAWEAPDRYAILVHRIVLELRPDLTRQYRVIRAPTLIFLSAEGEEIIRQDETVSDAQPIVLSRFEEQMEFLPLGEK